MLVFVENYVIGKGVKVVFIIKCSMDNWSEILGKTIITKLCSLLDNLLSEMDV